MSFKPIGNRILVEPSLRKESNSLIHIPESAKGKSQEGIVISLGTGKRNGDGELVPFEVNIGDRVLIDRNRGQDIKLDGKEVRLVDAGDIVAVLV